MSRVPTRKPRPPKLFVLYDGRARSGSTERASVMSTAASEREARREGREDWADYDAVWFEYDVAPRRRLINEKMRPDIPPGDVSGPGAQPPVSLR